MVGARQGRREPSYVPYMGATEDAASRRPARPGGSRLIVKRVLCPPPGGCGDACKGADLAVSVICIKVLGPPPRASAQGARSDERGEKEANMRRLSGLSTPRRSLIA